MSEITTMVMAEHRQVALDSQHPARAMAYELALAKRLGAHSHWGTRWSPSWATGRRSGLVPERHAVPHITPCAPDC
jgi:hypothetical protein